MLAQRVQRGLQRLAEAGVAVLAVRRQRVVRAVRGDRGLTREHVADDPDVLARAGQRLGERLAVPALDHLRPGDPEPEHEAAAAEMVERHRGHRRGRGTAGAHLHDPRPQAQPLGVRAPPGQRREHVAAVGLRGPDRVEAQALGLEHAVQRTGRRGSRRPVAGVQPELASSLAPELLELVPVVGDDREQALGRVGGHVVRRQRSTAAASPSAARARRRSGGPARRASGSRPRSSRTARRTASCSTARSWKVCVSPLWPTILTLSARPAALSAAGSPAPSALLTDSTT